MNLKLRNILITLSIVAGVLVIITFYVVFYSGSGTYVVSSLNSQDAGIFGSGNASATIASGTASSTLAFTSSSTSSSTTSSTDIGAASSTDIGSAPVTWTQGNETMTITDATVSGAQLTLGVQIAMGSATECVPLTMRLIADEQGDLSPPITPQFSFPDTGTCNGTAGETYSAQPVVFTLSNPGVFPILLTTGGTANTLFEVMQNTDGSLSVQLPGQSG